MNDDDSKQDRKPSEGSAGDEQLADPRNSIENEQVDDSSIRDSVGAYVLDALPESERVAFEAYLAHSPDTREEVRRLAPVVALLPKLLDLDIVGGDRAPSPSTDRRAVLMAAIQAGQAGSTQPDDSPPLSSGQPVAAPAGQARTIRTAPNTAGTPGSARAQGRIRSGTGTIPGARPDSTPISMLTRLPASWLAAAALLVVAVGAIFWALALQSRIDSKNREIVAQSNEIAQLTQNTDASTYTLAASDAAASDAGGTLLFSLKDKIGVLYVHDLPKLDRDRVYQLWYLDNESDAPKPGGVFTVDSNGNGTVVVASDTPTHDGIALTEEPEGGSLTPTSAILLLGELGGVTG